MTFVKYLIVCLGNIGEEYANTRHNIGFIIGDAMASDFGVRFTTDRYASRAEARFRGKTIVIIKPTTYMNLSGKAYRYWLTQENIGVENSLVVVDDLDLETGVLRMKTRGSGGSHNGLNNIIEVLGNSDFPRLRVGIGNNFARGYQVDYVLGRFTREEEKIFLEKIPVAVEMIKSFISGGATNTMNAYNNK
ncbi:MAG: peptidyl-tRNA hydrolase PTH1 family [Bacteroidetes bacterium]|nr:MAG: peptidyl-tRNA hydrolase PTH1 family [Bacteroidota bacterium]